MSQSLPRALPERQGVDTAAILAFIDAIGAGGIELHSMMVLRHGSVIAEGWWSPYRATAPHLLFSLSKSFTASAVGIALAESLLTLDDLVLSFFPDDAPADVSEYLAAMRVRDLLCMGTGHETDTTVAMLSAADGNWARAFLAQPVTHAPGTFFCYNSGATYMLSAIVQRLSGQTVLAYLEPRLLAPLGIVGATWETCPRGINVGGWGLSITTEDIARFGQLYLRRGSWNGAQLLSEAWVAEATRVQITNGTDAASDWAQGYGYQFWMCRHGGYRGDGAFGQYCVVLPECEVVIAITSGISDMQIVLSLVWELLLPGIDGQALCSDQRTQALLEARLDGLTLPQPYGNTSSPLEGFVGERRYHIATNDEGIAAVTLHFGDATATCVIEDGAGERALTAGRGTWHDGEAVVYGRRGLQRVAASGTWEDGRTYTLVAYLFETPFCLTHRFRFDDSGVTIERSWNVNFGPTSLATLTGH